MAFYQPKASVLADNLTDFRLCVKRGDYEAAARHARTAERVIDDFDRWRKRHKKIVDLWQTDDEEETA